MNSSDIDLTAAFRAVDDHRKKFLTLSRWVLAYFDQFVKSAHGNDWMFYNDADDTLSANLFTFLDDPMPLGVKLEHKLDFPKDSTTVNAQITLYQDGQVIVELGYYSNGELVGDTRLDFEIDNYTVEAAFAKIVRKIAATYPDADIYNALHACNQSGIAATNDHDKI